MGIGQDGHGPHPVGLAPHSYENIYFLQERYESVVLSRHMGAQTRAIPTLIHKAGFRMSRPRRRWRG
jgi:hypothetical protein